MASALRFCPLNVKMNNQKSGFNMVQNIDSLVITTINIPYSKKLDVQTLVSCLKNPDDVRFFSGPMSSFFTDVSAELKREFAAFHELSEIEMKVASDAFAVWSGKSAA